MNKSQQIVSVELQCIKAKKTSSVSDTDGTVLKIDFSPLLATQESNNTNENYSLKDSTGID